MYLNDLQLESLCRILVLNVEVEVAALLAGLPRLVRVEREQSEGAVLEETQLKSTRESQLTIKTEKYKERAEHTDSTATAVLCTGLAPHTQVKARTGHQVVSKKSITLSKERFFQN